MGAQLDTFTMPGEKSRKEVVAEFAKVVEQRQYDDGHGGYTGTLAEKCGYPLDFPGKVFISESAAIDWMHDEDKWGPAHAVIFCDEEGKRHWLIGGNCSS